jgi:hypothetical protein
MSDIGESWRTVAKFTREHIMTISILSDYREVTKMYYVTFNDPVLNVLNGVDVIDDRAFSELLESSSHECIC